MKMVNLRFSINKYSFFKAILFQLENNEHMGGWELGHRVKTGNHFTLT